MKILVLDNYDSFTYNLVHYIEKLSENPVDVYRNDAISLNAIAAYDKICLSPGPGLPGEAGIMIDAIKKYYKEKSILGICLGMQAIAEVFGGKLKNLAEVHHGIPRKTVGSEKKNLFSGLPEEFISGRYHSWVVDPDGFPEELEVIAIDEEKNIMALYHKQFDIGGVQFHPESVLTEYGEKIIENWVKK